MLGDWDKLEGTPHQVSVALGHEFDPSDWSVGFHSLSGRDERDEPGAMIGAGAGGRSGVDDDELMEGEEDIGAVWKTMGEGGVSERTGGCSGAIGPSPP